MAAMINVAFLYAVHIWPGWQAVPFLTEDTPRVLGLVNLSLAAGMVSNLIYVVYDAPWFKALGDVVTTAIGLASLLRIYRVFPFAFSESSIDWLLVTRVVLIVGIVGTIIGIVVQTVVFIRRVVQLVTGT